MRGLVLWNSSMQASFETRNELERAGSGIGSINPNWPVDMDLEPDMVQHLKSN